MVIADSYGSSFGVLEMEEEDIIPHVAGETFLDAGESNVL